MNSPRESVRLGLAGAAVHQIGWVEMGREYPAGTLEERPRRSGEPAAPKVRASAWTVSLPRACAGHLR